MILFPNCKINLGLRILGKREDGYHDLETIFYPLPLLDAVEVLEAGAGKVAQHTDVEFTQSGLQIEGNAQDNLCVKAYHLLKEDFPLLPPVQMWLHKAIPAGAGLGGGSSDGVSTLKLLNEKFNLNLSGEQLATYALQFGSDCPFFVVNRPCIATGRGEVLEEIKLSLRGYVFVLVHPGIHVNTGWAFSRLLLTDTSGRFKGLGEIIDQRIETWKEELQNDFEGVVFTEYPEIRAIKEKLYSSGALYASMSGSGSAVFGIFKEKQMDRLQFPGHYFVKELVGQ